MLSSAILSHWFALSIASAYSDYNQPIATLRLELTTKYFMVKLTILFKQPTDLTVFENHYNEGLALLEKMPDIRRRQACVVLGSPAGQSPYYRMLEFYFDSREALDAAMLSEAGTAAGHFLVSFAGRAVELLFSDVFEA